MKMLIKTFKCTTICTTNAQTTTIRNIKVFHRVLLKTCCCWWYSAANIQLLIQQVMHASCIKNLNLAYILYMAFLEFVCVCMGLCDCDILQENRSVFILYFTYFPLLLPFKYEYKNTREFFPLKQDNVSCCCLWIPLFTIAQNMHSTFMCFSFRLALCRICQLCGLTL